MSAISATMMRLHVQRTVNAERWINKARDETTDPLMKLHLKWALDLVSDLREDLLKATCAEVEVEAPLPIAAE